MVEGTPDLRFHQIGINSHADRKFQRTENEALCKDKFYEESMKIITHK